MPTAKPRLSRTAQQGIRELRERHNVEPTLDEVIWLHELGKVVERSGRPDGIIDGPSQAGSAFLWPLTLMASHWYRNYAYHWYHTSPLFSFYALAFAMAHGRGDPIPATERGGWLERLLRRSCGVQECRTLDTLIDRREASDAIELWVSQAKATRDELEAAVDAVLGLTEAEDKDPVKKAVEEDSDYIPTGINYEDMLHELATLSGVEPDYWRTRTSKDSVLRAYINVTAIEKARRGVSGPGPRDALGEAIHQFRRAITAIIKAHKQADANQEAAE